MSLHRWNKWQAAGGFAAFALAAVVGFVACDSDVGRKSAASSDTGETSDDEGVEQIPGDDPTKGFQGPSTGGTIPQADRDATVPLPPPDFSQVDADTRCCNVTFVLPDPTNDEAVASFGADLGVGSTPAGVPLTYANGAWSANVCMPVGVVIHY